MLVSKGLNSLQVFIDSDLLNKIRAEKFKVLDTSNMVMISDGRHFSFDGLSEDGIWGKTEDGEEAFLYFSSIASVDKFDEDRKKLLRGVNVQ